MIVKESLLPIEEVAAKLGLGRDRLYLYGPHMAKVLGEPPKPRGRLVLVTAITPTPAGEGKTTTAIGLVDALWRLGKRAALALREPSLGPVFGVKGGATGGGKARLEPRHEINLHFTGDFHAVTSAVNLLNALLDNHLHQGNELGIDPRRVELKRAIDMNDRALRHIVLGLGGKAHGVPREGGFELTVASEVMALMSLAQDFQDLKRRLGRMRVAFTYEGKPVYAVDLQAVGAMAALLRQAFLPNLVQTAEGNPAFVHMGPFGNIAHGTNSLRASLFALGLADLVVQEAGFATDLGMEKFMNVVARTGGLVPEAVVLVATLRALRYHGGQDACGMPDPKAVKEGLANLEKHVENVELFGYKPVIALNRFPGDTPEEIALVRAFAEERGFPFALSEVYAKGGEGGLELAERVLEALALPHAYRPLYPLEAPLEEKVLAIATRVYGAEGVEWSEEAKRALKAAKKEGCEALPVVVAKAATSLSDNPRLRGRPRGFTVRVTDLRCRLGAGFVVVYMGGIETLPGLPKTPQAFGIDVDEEGNIRGMDY
ncbi:Formate-tetrahydrofolate ligase [Thermus arciformis]|uniref:Formate--tetrahydrofolate ligase n=1 Tax=Thermus arciformis TaxID=482827 RepID=A0A1G7JYU6_9DEIN|nr:formate--tetrahydrofolate ligase [Thermus arciformis]SDF30015.1 Formate-tetrahydrofolate ligase [Thermus arciformis]